MKQHLATLLNVLDATELVLGAGVLVLAGAVFILWLWYYRLYRAAGLVFVSSMFSHDPGTIIMANDTGREKPAIGVSTGIYYERDILETLPLIREAGYDTVEIWAGPQKWGEYTHFNWHKEYRAHALSVCLKVLGLRVNSLHAPFSDNLDLSDPSELRRRLAVDEVLRTLEVLKRLGGEYLVIHPAAGDNSLRNRDIHFRQSRKSIEDIHLCLQGMGVKLAVENQLPHILGGDPETLLALIEGLPESEVGVCFDTSHANLYGRGVDETYRRLAQRVVTTHVSDNFGKVDDHFIPGDGNVNWHALVSAMGEKGYRGVFMLEIVAETNGSDKMSVLRNGYQRARELLRGTLKEIA